MRGKPFEKGNAGKPKGAVNNLTKTFKDLLILTLEEIQADPKANLLTWAKDNPTEFYKIASKLIPTEVKAEVAPAPMVCPELSIEEIRRIHEALEKEY